MGNLSPIIYFTFLKVVFSSLTRARFEINFKFSDSVDVLGFELSQHMKEVCQYWLRLTNNSLSTNKLLSDRQQRAATEFKNSTEEHWGKAALQKIGAVQVRNSKKKLLKESYSKFLSCHFKICRWIMMFLCLRVFKFCEGCSRLFCFE